jgi:hypothetical protein
MNELKKEEKKRSPKQSNKLSKYKKSFFRVYILNEKKGLAEPVLNDSSFKEDKRKRPNEIDEYRLMRYNYLKKGYNIRKKLTPAEILLLEGEGKITERSLTHLRDVLKRLVNKKVLIKYQEDYGKIKRFVYGFNYKYNLPFFFLWVFPSLSKIMYQNKGAFELSMDDLKNKDKILKSHGETALSMSDAPKSEKKIVRKILSNWENKEEMEKLLRGYLPK